MFMLIAYAGREREKEEREREKERERERERERKGKKLLCFFHSRKALITFVTHRFM